MPDTFEIRSLASRLEQWQDKFSLACSLWETVSELPVPPSTQWSSQWTLYVVPSPGGPRDRGC